MIRVEVQRAADMFGTAVFIVDQDDAGSRPREVLRLRQRHEESGTYVLAASGDSYHPNEAVEPVLILPDDILRALCDALTRFYTGTEDSRALRRDYDAERKRTDALIGHLAAISRALAEPQP